jgi:hypothetical protein
LYYYQALSTKKTELQSESQLQQNQVAGGSHSGRMVGVARMPNGDFLRASVRRSSIAPVPGILSEEGSESFSGVDVSGCSATFPVFSVARGFAGIPANACSALLSFSLSDSLRGACVPRSMIWPSSSRSTFTRGHLIVAATPGTWRSGASPVSVSPAVSAPRSVRDVRGQPSCRFICQLAAR